MGLVGTELLEAWQVMEKEASRLQPITREEFFTEKRKVKASASMMVLFTRTVEMGCEVFENKVEPLEYASL